LYRVPCMVVRLNPLKLLNKALSSRVKGSHHIFARPNVPELLNLQDIDGKAKPYQVKQLLGLVERHNLSLRKEE